jgi:predicted ABC-type transport system involved in lysophospholipase L1 biosynthesis ATPase subunit
MALLSLEEVSKRYPSSRREVVVLDRVSLEVEAGEALGVWGGRRSGKSTLLRVAAGIEPPDGGIVRFDGRDVARMSGRERARLLRREIGFAATWLELGRRAGTARSDRVLDLVAVPLIADGWDRREAMAAAWRELETVGATGCADAGSHELSPGEQTRVALARALIRQPRVLIVDEPSITPSPRERDSIRTLLHSVAKRPERTLIVASEDLGGVRGTDRVVAVRDGHVVTSDRPGQVVPFPGPTVAGEGSMSS